MQLTGLTLRIPLVQGLRNGLTNKLTSKLDGIPRGNGVVLQHAVFVADPKAATLFDDLSTITSISMVMRKESPGGDFILQKDVAIADFDTPNMTWTQWDSNTHQQFSIVLTPEDTNQEIAEGKDSLSIYLAWEAMLASGVPVFLGSLKTSIFEEGIGTAGIPTAGDPLYYTAAQSDARYRLAVDHRTAPLVVGQSYVDVAVPAGATQLGSLGIMRPSADADAIDDVSCYRVSSTVLRITLNAAPAVTGYTVLYFARIQPVVEAEAEISVSAICQAIIPVGQSYVDITIPAGDRRLIPWGVEIPSAATEADNIAAPSCRRLDATTARLLLSAAPTVSGCIGRIFAPFNS